MFLGCTFLYLGGELGWEEAERAKKNVNVLVFLLGDCFIGIITVCNK